MTDNTSGSSEIPSLPTPSLDTIPVERLKRVGPRVAERLGKLGVRTLQDLLFHLPHRYQDRTRLVRIAELRPGDEALVEGEIQEVELSGGRRRSLKVWVSDGGFGGLMLRFFHYSRQQIDALKPGVRLRCYGEVRQGPSALEMVHPEYRIQSEEPGAIEERLTPLYPSTEGLQQSSWRGLTDQALALLASQAPRECLPEEVLLPLGLPGLVEALIYLHRPPCRCRPRGSDRAPSSGLPPARVRGAGRPSGQSATAACRPAGDPGACTCG